LCAERIAQNEGVPPFCKNASDVATRALDPDSTSTDLARIVLKDLGLASLILRVANSARYNRSGVPVMSVAHAIILMGWDTVRNLVSTARYIEYFARRGAGLREMLVLSVLSAVHSRDIAAAIGYPAPDEAHVTGLFRNLGEIMIGCHYPREYSSIILTMQGDKIDGRAACLRVLGFGWDEVGGRVAEAWNLPPGLIRCLCGSARAGGSARERSLASVTDYARDLTHAVYRDGGGIESLHLRCVDDPQGRRVLVSVRDLVRIVDGARCETQSAFAALGIPTADLRLEQQAQRARAVLAAERVFDAGAVHTLEAAAESAMRTMRRGEFDLNALIGELLASIRAAGFGRAIFGLVSEDYRFIRGRLASAGVDDELLRRFDFRVDRRDGPVSAALQRRNDLMVDCARDGRYDRSDLVRIFAPAAFALLPVIVDERAAACIYADRGDAAPGLDTMLYPLGRLRDVIASALRKRGQSTKARTGTQ
jgi:HD-like signal output (HDOD) protein